MKSVKDNAGAQPNAPTTAEVDSATKISKPSAADQEARVQQYLDDMAAETGLTREELLLLNELAQADEWVDCSGEQEPKDWPVTDVELTQELNAYRASNMRAPVPVEAVRALMRKLFKARGVNIWEWEHITVNRTLVPEPSYNGVTETLPRYDVFAPDTEQFAKNLDDVREGRMTKTASGLWFRQEDKDTAEPPPKDLTGEQYGLDPAFAASGIENRVRMYLRDLWERAMHKSFGLRRLSPENAWLIHDILECPSGDYTAADFAACLNQTRREAACPFRNIKWVSPVEVTLALNLVFMAPLEEGTGVCRVDGKTITRSLQAYQEESGNTVQVPLYRYVSDEDGDDDLYDQAHNAIVAGRLFKTHDGQWVDMKGELAGRLPAKPLPAKRITR